MKKSSRSYMKTVTSRDNSKYCHVYPENCLNILAIMKIYGFFKSLLDQEHKNYSNCYNQPYYKIFFTICWRSTLKLRSRQTWMKCQGIWQCYETRAPPDPQCTAGSKTPDSAPSEHSALDLCFAGMPALFSTSILPAKLGMGSSPHL